MKRFWHVFMAVLVVTVVVPIGLAFAQKAPPKLLIAYPGDTDGTIKRRSQWIEGAKKEGTMTFWSTPSPDNIRKMLAEFNKVYPYIKVEYWRGNGEAIAAKMEVGHASGRPEVDVACGAGELINFQRWRNIGMLEKFTDIIPGAGKFDKRMLSKYGDWARAGLVALTPQYNTNLVSAEEAPKSWEDLADPKWKGKIGLTTDVKAWVALALDGGWGIEKTEQFLIKLRNQEPIWTTGHTAAHNLLTAGEFKILAEDYNYHVPASKQKGAPVDWVRVNPVVVTGPPFTLLNKASHPNAARLFLEWILSPQGMVAFEKATFHGAVYPGADTLLAKLLDGLNLVYMSEEMEMKATEIKLFERFSKLLEAKP